ncbi:hypothetical protein PR048_024716 [Dryococelus australis]|uniref:Uncharacterized protein n=1 Tax=Dryococelus australis TaxID=614101 RepID=A0ABQ9GPC4_9NEOP|nr:hypothetical protein PR048_024716 [Dryococelus australis]
MPQPTSTTLQQLQKRTLFENVPVEIKLQSCHHKTVKEIRLISSFIISCISHLEKCRCNTVYTSPEKLNELIGLCGKDIRENIIRDTSPEYCIGFGCDDCSTMAGKEGSGIDHSKKLRSQSIANVNGKYATRKFAYQLHSAVLKPLFIVALITIANYSAVLEPVVNALQAKSMNLIADSDRITDEILKKNITHCNGIGNFCSTSCSYAKPQEQSSIRQQKYPALTLTELHPLYMTKTSITDLHMKTKLFTNFYELDVVAGELDLWYNLWMNTNFPADKLRDTKVIDLFNETNIFSPRHQKSPFNFEYYSITLRRVKTWLRSTMGDERLTGLCLMSVHRNVVKGNRDMVEKNVLDKFSANPR